MVFEICDIYKRNRTDPKIENYTTVFSALSQSPWLCSEERKESLSLKELCIVTRKLT